MRLLLLVLIGVSFTFGTNAALDPTADYGKSKPLGGGQDYNKANCPPSDGLLYMDFNDVEALVEVGGSLWQDRQAGAASYEVPVGGGNHVLFSGSIWMGGVDVNGQLKLAAVLFRTSGNDFWGGPLSVVPGSGNYDPSQPVGDNSIRPFGLGTIDPETCIEYDKFFPIAKSEVINFTLRHECSIDPNCTDPSQYPLTNDAIERINNWPAHGDDVVKKQDYYLAPFYDYPSQGGSGDGTYDPSQGDVPWFDDILGRDDVNCGIDRRVTLFGDKTNWWVFNDKGNIHTETGGDPIGMEIRAQAFSFATNDEVNRMTFYNYEMINRSSTTLEDTYFSQYADADIGFAEDDYVGCDVSRGLGYAYNGDNTDEGGNGAPGYGDNPPAVGIDFFEGPYQDADNIDNVGPRLVTAPDGTTEYVTPTVNEAIAGKGIVYEGIGIGYSDGIIDNERFGMRRFNYFDRGDLGTPSTDDPSSPSDFYNYMTGFWKDNSAFIYGGKGYTGTPGAVEGVPADYCYPGDTDPLHFGTRGQDMGWDWSELDVDGNGTSNPIGDRRFLQSAGPFTLTPGAVNNLTVGVVYGRSYDGNSFASVEALRKNDTKAQALFDNCFEILDPPSAPILEIVELENELVLMIDNPFGNNVNEEYAEEDNINIVDPLDGSEIDKVYNFEGYQIYQMVDDEAGVSDIGLTDKARLVAQCDIENDIDRIINFEFDEELGFSKPELKVDGQNQGIRHSFQITEDQFTGNALVNHKTYYYIAIAYAHNEFKKYDPTDPQLLDGQTMPYISSRLSADGSAIKATVGIPHSPQPRFDGTIVNLPYGSSPEITTLDGKGNGNRVIDLTQATEDFIVANGSVDTPTYQQGKGPIDVKVVDPLNLVDGYFMLEFVDYNSNLIDTASWTIKRYDSKGGNLIEEVSSNRTIEFKNEQLIPEWGLSVAIYQDNYPCAQGTENCNFRDRIAKPIETTLEFADSSKRWLSGVSDVDTYTPFNWIASGDYTTTDCNEALGLNNPCCYLDLVGVDPDKEFASIFSGTVTLGQLARRNDCGFMPIGIPNVNGIDEGSFSSIEKTQMPSVYQTSVDIVITQDKSKWTRCPVIELGSDENLNINGGLAGLLRQSPSIDKNGNQVGDPGYNASEANPNGTTAVGMGWFPGYAIDVETGRRLNMAYGENSFLVGENGADMIWNPTSNLVNSTGSPLFGGQHVVYVFGNEDQEIPNYDEGEFIYNKLASEDEDDYKDVYGGLSWVINPTLAEDAELLSTDVRMRIRINKEYAEYAQSNAFGGRPTYEWNMDGFRTIKNDEETLADALDMINVVPNPYYAYSDYELGRLDTRVKITNLPERCKVRIYNTSGKLIRAYDKDSPITSIDWDLKNDDNISVAGGVYLIHVDVEGIGERVVKFFGGLRQTDLENL
ncbi:T9SS C-terminal target domain-containing protein [Brumimicrobium aurantiacum]|uniref:T9SS C-terminal target domain-containing protein n=1 Tax=Brumimicrobium aurantiacum TaxID=1737063 RepID=A0A3E1EYB4_9FLAO|nr:T9SS C-terminal target domain-containing protein [Brumimicrobium aurantiacum]RFC54534.1 T9SS C-terminal target domain-containing protein [Brumimicrobium aurantiacum]